MLPVRDFVTQKLQIEIYENLCSRAQADDGVLAVEL
jgi:hypothetical protein